MSMRGFDLQKIDAPNINAGMAAALGLKGEKQGAQNVDVGAIDLVWDVSQGGMAGATFVSANDAAAFTLAASADKDHNVVGPGNFSATIIADTLQGGVVQNARLLGGSYYVTFDAAGIAAFATKQIAFTVRLRNIALSKSIEVYSEKRTLVAGQLSNLFCVGAGLWNGLIPAGHVVNFNMVSCDGTNFPANSTGSCSVSIVRAAAGVELPR